MEALASHIARPAKRPHASDDIDGATASEAHQHHTSDTTSLPRRVVYGPGPLAGIKLHPELWLDDGNLILVANRHTAFRVYAGLLASQSEIFTNLFAVASLSPDEVYDGCPVVPVYDTPGEFAHFLHVLIPKESRNFYRTAKKDGLWSFDAAAAVVRLAHKYSLPGIRDQALELIEEHAFGPARSPHRPLCRRDPVLAFEPVHAIGAVNLARLVDRPAMRLAALYRCAALGAAALHGWARDDGVVERLDPMDLRVCMDAHPALVRARVALCARVFDDTPNEDCMTGKQCQAGLRKLGDVMVGDEFWEHAGGVLDDWEVGLAKEAGGCGVCRSCAYMVETRDREEKGEAWKRMPEIFNVEVEGWETRVGWI